MPKLIKYLQIITFEYYKIVNPILNFLISGTDNCGISTQKK